MLILWRIDATRAIRRHKNSIGIPEDINDADTQYFVVYFRGRFYRLAAVDSDRGTPVCHGGGYPVCLGRVPDRRFAAFPFGKDLVDARDLGGERLIGTGLANFFWIVLAGIWLAISHILAGAGLCLTIIGIPFGFAHFRLAMVCFAPLGKRVVYH